MIVTLSKQDEAQCQQASRMRYQMNRASNIQQQRKAPKAAGNIELLGIRCECAVARVLDVDFHPYHLGIDSGVDLFAGDIAIDVKGRNHGNGLIFQSKSRFKADVAVLVEAEGDALRIIGCASKQSFFKSAQTRDFGHGECAFLPDENLEPIERLWRLMTERRVNERHSG